MSAEIPSILLEPSNVQVAATAFDTIQHNLLKGAIVQAVSIGAAASILIIMMLQSKKKGVMHWLHVITLIIVLIRAGLYLGYLWTPLASMSFIVGGILTSDPMPGFRLTVATNVFQILLVTIIQVSFAYQTYSMFRHPQYKTFGYLLTSFNICFGLVIIIFQTYAVAKNANMLYQGLFKAVEVEISDWVVNLPVILMSVSINIMSLILMVKLGRAIKRRRFLGIKQFSNLHILLIGSCQTFFIPTILVIVEYSKADKLTNSILYTISLLLVVLTMPIVTMWAKMTNTQPKLETSSLLFYTPSIRSESDNETVIGTDEKALPQDIADLINDDSFQEFKTHQVFDTK